MRSATFCVFAIALLVVAEARNTGLGNFLVHLKARQTGEPECTSQQEQDAIQTCVDEAQLKIPDGVALSDFISGEDEPEVVMRGLHALLKRQSSESGESDASSAETTEAETGAGGGAGAGAGGATALMHSLRALLKRQSSESGEDDASSAETTEAGAGAGTMPLVRSLRALLTQNTKRSSDGDSDSGDSGDSVDSDMEEDGDDEKEIAAFCKVVNENEDSVLQNFGDCLASKCPELLPDPDQPAPDCSKYLQPPPARKGLNKKALRKLLQLLSRK